jgi:response regulator NasT
MIIIYVDESLRRGFYECDPREVIERAKGVLMKLTGLDEPEVFRRLQKLSRDQNQKMVEVARMILPADEAFRPV